MTTPTAPSGTTSTSTLSDWAGPYVTNMLGKSQALGNEGYQMYDGPRTAGPSSLQQQAYSGIAGLSLPQGDDYQAADFTSNYDANQHDGSYDAMGFSSYLPGTSDQNPYGVGSIDSYMNPYLQGVLDPQIREANRQAQISQMGNADRFSKAGAFGGSRQAIMDAELQRNLLQGVGDMTGRAYASAFDNAQNQQFRTAQLGLDAQRATEQSRQFGAGHGLDTFRANEDAWQKQGSMDMEAQRLSDASRQFGSNFSLEAGKLGMAGLEQQLRAGDQQRGIEQDGLDADYKEFEQQRDHPYRQLEFMQKMLGGMPISTVSNSPNPQSNSQQWAGLLADLAEMFGGD